MKTRYKIWLHIEEVLVDRQGYEDAVEEAAEPLSVETLFTTLERAEDARNDMIDSFERRQS